MTSLVSSPWSDGRQFNVEAEGVYTERFKLLAADGVASDEFGTAVAISRDGGTVAVSAVRDSGNYLEGDVYVFIYDGNYWVQQAKISLEDKTTKEKFGNSLSISSDGNTLAVASIGISEPDGSVYIFVRSGSSWTKQARLIASGIPDYFAHSVSISGSGNTVVVGSRWNGADKGISHIFTRSGTVWNQLQTLLGSDTVDQDAFGTSVTISEQGDTIAVGSPFNSLTGSVYIFTLSGSTWTQQAKLRATDGASGDRFGISVSISSDGNKVLIGSSNTTANLNHSGYIFTRTGTSWSQQSKLVGSDSKSDYGSAVSLSGDGNVAIIGDPAATGAANISGAAYAHIWSGTVWVQKSKLIAGDGLLYDRFGHSVGISGDSGVVAVGCRLDDDKGSGSGSVYIFTRTIADTSFENGSNLISPELEKIAAGFGYNVAMDDTGLEMLVSHLYSNKSTDESFEVEDRGNVIFYKRGANGLFELGLKLKPEIPIDVTLPSGGSLTLSSTGYTKNVTSSGRIWIPEISNSLTISGKGSDGYAGSIYYRHNARYVLDSDTGIDLLVNNVTNVSNSTTGPGGRFYGFATSSPSNLTSLYPSGMNSSATIELFHRTGTGGGGSIDIRTTVNVSLNSAPRVWGNYVYWTASGTNEITGSQVTVRIMFENSYSGTYSQGAYSGDSSSAKFLGVDYSFSGGTTSSPTAQITSFSNIKTSQKQSFLGHAVELDRSSSDSLLRAYVTMLNKAVNPADDSIGGLVFTYKLPSTSPTTVIQSPDTVDKKTDSFGYALSVSKGSEFLAVSDPEVSISGYANAGRVYIYKRNVDDWVLEKKLDQNTASTLNGKFGSSISLKKDPITGTYILAVKSSNKIELYYRVESGGVGNWVLSQTFTASAGESFGGAIAFSMSCNRLVAASGTKHVYIFDRNGSDVSWSRSSTVLEIKHPNKDTTALSGRNISISENGNVIVIGSYDATTKGQLDVFRFSSGTWGHVKTLTPPDAGFNANGSAYGWSHAMSEDGTTLIAGVNDLSMTTSTFANYAY